MHMQVTWHDMPALGSKHRWVQAGGGISDADSTMPDFNLKMICYVIYDINNILEDFYRHLSRSTRGVGGGGWGGGCLGKVVTCCKLLGPRMRCSAGGSIP
jgi:hypothetical protein